MTKPLNRDFKVIKACAQALDESSSRKMLIANLEFLWDRYIRNPFHGMPEHLKEREDDS